MKTKNPGQSSDYDQQILSSFLNHRPVPSSVFLSLGRSGRRGGIPGQRHSSRVACAAFGPRPLRKPCEHRSKRSADARPEHGLPHGHPWPASRTRINANTSTPVGAKSLFVFSSAPKDDSVAESRRWRLRPPSPRDAPLQGEPRGGRGPRCPEPRSRGTCKDRISSLGAAAILILAAYEHNRGTYQWALSGRPADQPQPTHTSFRRTIPQQRNSIEMSAPCEWKP